MCVFLCSLLVWLSSEGFSVLFQGGVSVWLFSVISLCSFSV